MDLINNPWFVLVLGMGTVFIGLFLLVLIIKVMGFIAVSYTHLTLPTNREV